MATITKLGSATGCEIIQTDTANLTNSTTTTDLMSYTIPGGSIGLFSALILEAAFEITTDSTPPGFNLSVHFGASSLALLSDTSFVSNLTNQPFRLRVMLTNLGSASSQLFRAELIQGETVFSGRPSNLLASSDLAVDSSADQTIKVQCRFTAADTGTTLYTKSITIRL